MHYAWSSEVASAVLVTPAVQRISSFLRELVGSQMLTLAVLSLALGRGWPPVAAAAAAVGVLTVRAIHDSLRSPWGIGPPLLSLIPFVALTLALMASARAPARVWRARIALGVAASALAFFAWGLTNATENMLATWRDLPDVPAAAMAPALCLHRTFGVHVGALAAAVALLALDAPPEVSLASAFAVAAAGAAADVAAERAGGAAAAAVAACGRSSPPALAVALFILSAAAVATAWRRGEPLYASRRCPCRSSRYRPPPPP